MAPTAVAPQKPVKAVTITKKPAKPKAKPEPKPARTSTLIPRPPPITRKPVLPAIAALNKACRTLEDGGCLAFTKCVTVSIKARRESEFPAVMDCFEKRWGAYYNPAYVFTVLTQHFYSLGPVKGVEGSEHVFMHVMNETGTKELLRLDFKGYGHPHCLNMVIHVQSEGRYPKCLEKWVAAWWFGYGGGPFRDWDMKVEAPLRWTNGVWQMRDKVWDPAWERDIIEHWQKKEGLQAALDFTTSQEIKASCK